MAALRARLGTGDPAAGAGLVAGCALLLFNPLTARAGLRPSAVFRPVLCAVGGPLAVVLLRACAHPDPAISWRTALRAAAYDEVRRLRGSAVLLLATATAAVCAWACPPLAVPVPGPWPWRPGPRRTTHVPSRRRLSAGPRAGCLTTGRSTFTCRPIPR